MSTSTTAGSEHPSISIHISTSSSTLDLSLDIPFTITIKTTPNTVYPVTFQKRHVPLLTNPLCTPGLTFKNTRTGEYAPRPDMHVCYLPANDNGLPTERYRKKWMTLYPDHSNVVEATLRPRLTIDPPSPTLGMTAAAFMELQSQQTPVRKWGLVRGLEDGQTYEIGISEGMGAKEWLKGDLEEILNVVKAGTIPELSREMIGFEVVQGARFTMNRPDADGSLNDVL